jgi:hypothetical protein
MNAAKLSPRIAGGLERREVEAGRPAFRDDGDGHHEQDQRLGHQQHAEQSGPEFDSVPADSRDDGDADDCDHRPLHVDVEDVVQGRLGLGGEQPVDADLQGGVGHQRQQSRREAGRFAESPGDVGVEGAGRVDMPGHARESDCKDHQDETGAEIRAGGADSADQEGQRGHPGHRRQWGGGGDDEEDDPAGAEDVPAQVGSGRGGRIGCSHRTSPSDGDA